MNIIILYYGLYYRIYKLFHISYNDYISRLFNKLHIIPDFYILVCSEEFSYDITQLKVTQYIYFCYIYIHLMQINIHIKLMLLYGKKTT